MRRTAAGIEVELPRWVTGLVAASVRALRQEMQTAGSAPAAALLAPIDESADHDDPLVTLMRQSALDEVLDAVEATISQPVLSDADAEVWLEGLGLLLAARAAHLGVRTEADRRRVAKADEAFFQVLYTLQLGLLGALDAPVPE